MASQKACICNRWTNKKAAKLIWNERKKSPTWQHILQMWRLHSKDQHWMMDWNMHRKAPLPPCLLETPSPCRTFCKLCWTWVSEPQTLVTRKTENYHDHGTWYNCKIYIHPMNISGWHQHFYMSNLDCNILRRCQSKAHNRRVFLALDLLGTSQAKHFPKLKGIFGPRNAHVQIFFAELVLSF